MLGWCPPPSLQNRASSDRTGLPQSHESTLFLDENPVLQPPHQIVIGFDLGIADNSKSLHTQACESPRSVLEPHRQKSASPRSPLSALGSLLTDRACIGSNGLKAGEFTGEHAYQNVLKIEHAICGAERGGTRKTPDSVALSRLRASKNQMRERQSHFSRRTDVHGCSRSSTILSSDDEDDCHDCEMDISKSIFSAASPVSHHSMLKKQTVDFLSNCFRCRRRLSEGKDIFMYRGDQAFCSQECRYKQIVADECKRRSPMVTPCYSGGTNDHKSAARATQAAFA